MGTKLGGSNSSNAVIVVQFTGDTKGLDDAFGISERSAQKFASSVAKVFDKAVQSSGAKSLNDQILALTRNAEGARRALSAMGEFKYGRTESSITRIKTALEGLNTAAANAQKSVAGIKLDLGVSVSQIRELTSQLKQLNTLGATAGSRASNTVANLAQQATNASANRGRPTIAGVDTYRDRDPMTFRDNRQYQKWLNAQSYEYRQSQPDTLRDYKARQNSARAQREAELREPVRNTGTGARYNEFIKNAEREATAAGTNAGAGFAKGMARGMVANMSNLSREIDSLGKTASSRFATYFTASFAADALYGTFIRMARELGTLAKETVLYAARTQELQVVLNSLAKVNNVSTEAIQQQELALRSLNITTKDSRETLARFLAVGFDIKDASPLARVAQDLAIITGKNTSQALDGLVVAIQTLQSRNLRNVGVYLTVDEVLDKLSVTTGRARDSFSTLEKQQAVLNAVMQYGTRVAGSYEAAMTTASKQLRSMERLVAEAKNAIGEKFIPVLEAFVSVSTTVLETITKYPDTFINIAKTIGLATVALVAFRTQAIQGAVEGAVGLFTSAKDSLLGTKALVSQTELNALKAQQLALEIEINYAKIASIDQQAAQLVNEGKMTIALERRLQLEMQILEAKGAQQTAALNNFNKEVAVAGKADSIAKALGNLALVGTLLYAGYTIGKGVYDAATAPRDVKAEDTNLSLKNQRDLENIRALQEKINNLYKQEVVLYTVASNLRSDNVEQTALAVKDFEETSKRQLTLQEQYSLLNDKEVSSVTINKEKLSVIQELSIASRAELENLQKQGLAQSQITDAVKERLLAEKQSKEETIQAQLGKSSAGLGDAIKNYTESQTKLQTALTNKQRYTSNPAGAATDALGLPIDVSTGEVLPNGQLAGVGNIQRANEVITNLATNTDKQYLQMKNKFEELMTLSVNYGISFEDTAYGIIESLGAETLATSTLKVEVENLAKAKRDELSVTLAKISVTSDPSRMLDNAYGAGREKAVQDEINLMKQQYRQVLGSTREGSPERERLLAELTNEATLQSRTEKALEAYNLSFARGQTGEQNKKTFSDAINRKVREEEITLGKKLTGQERLNKTIEVYNRLIKEDPSFQAFDNALKQSDTLNIELERTQQLLETIYDTRKGRLTSAQSLLIGIQSQNPENRKRTFEAEAVEQQASQIKEYLKLRFELYNKVGGEDQSLYTDPAKVKDALRALEREKSVRDSIRQESEKQHQIEDEIRILRETKNLPAINAELLLQKAVLEQVKERKQAEQQLTADIATEIVKRRKFGVDSQRLIAESYLEVKRGETSSVEEAIKSFAKNQLERGDASLYVNNDIVREAVKQSEKLAEIDKKGGVQAIKLDESNAIALTSQSVLRNVVSSVQVSGDNIVRAISAYQLSSSYTSSVPSSFGSPYVSSVESFTNGYRNSPRDIKETTQAYSNILNSVYFQTMQQAAAFVKEKFGFNVRPEEAALLGAIESKGKPNVKSPANAKGLMQVLNDPGGKGDTYGANYRALIRAGARLENNPYNPTTSIYAGVYEIGKLKRQFGDDFDLTASAYNSGPGGAEKFGKIENVNETKAYVGLARNVIKNIKSQGIRSTSQVENQIRAEIGKKSATPEVSIFQDPAIQALYQKVYGTTPNEKATKGDVDFAKDFDSERINATRAHLDTYRNLQAIKINGVALAKEEVDKVRDAFEIEKLREELFIEENKRAAERSVITDRIISIENSGFERAKIASEYKTKKEQEYYDLLKTSVELSEESSYRKERREEYLRNQKLVFDNEQIANANKIEDDEIALFNRRKAFQDEESKYSANLRKQAELDRDKARQDLEERVRLAKLYASYLKTDTARVDFEKQVNADILDERNKLQEDIIKTELRTVKAQEDMELRLYKVKVDYLESYSKRHEEFLTRQLNAELELENKRRELFNPDEFRADALENILDKTKSTTELMSGLWNDSFDSIVEGFGGLIDKGVAKMGIFGKALGNFAKGLFNRIFGQITNNLLDRVVPKNNTVNTVLGATGVNELLLDGANSMSNASSYTAGQVVGLGNAAGAAAVALMQIAGQVSNTALGIGGLLRGGKGGATGATGLIGRGTSGVLRAITGMGNPFSTYSRNSLTEGELTSGSGIATLGGLVGGSTSTVAGKTASISLDQASVIAKTLGVGTSTNRGGGLGSLLKGLGLKDIGTSALASLPSLGSGLGSLLGGESGIGRTLGGIGGLIGGGVGLGLIGSAVGGSALGGIFGSGGALAAFGGLSAATLGIGAAIAGAFLLASFLFGRSKRNKLEKKNVNQWSSDALQQMKDLLKGVQTDKIDGDEAISRSAEIIKTFQDNLATLKSKGAKQLGQQKLVELQSLQAQIKQAAASQTRRKETDAKIVPTYAMGGMADTEMIRVSRGEKLYHPAVVPFMRDAIASAGIPNGGSAFNFSGKIPNNPVVKIPGTFDGKDDILALVPRGTLIANPSQQSVLQAKGYANGGFANTSVAGVAAQPIIQVQQPPVNVIVVLGQEEASKMVAMTPDAIVVNKVRTHVRSTGANGLAGDVANTFR